MPRNKSGWGSRTVVALGLGAILSVATPMVAEADSVNFTWTETIPSSPTLSISGTIYGLTAGANAAGTPVYVQLTSLNNVSWGSTSGNAVLQANSSALYTAEYGYMMGAVPTGDTVTVTDGSSGTTLSLTGTGFGSLPVYTGNTPADDGAIYFGSSGGAFSFLFNSSSCLISDPNTNFGHGTTTGPCALSNVGNVGGTVTYSNYQTGTFTPPVSPVPLPAAAWLMLSGLGGLGALARKKRAKEKSNSVLAA